jgi:hypothetical protein
MARAEMPAARLEHIRRRDREATRRRRAIARGLPDPGPVPDWRMAEKRLRLPQGRPLLGTWVLAGACREEDPELWFSADPVGLERAQAICARCPVRVPVLGCGRGERRTVRHVGRHRP